MRSIIRTLPALLVAAALGLAAAPSAQAQQRGDDGRWWEWAVPVILGGEQVPTRSGRVYVPRRSDDARRDGRGEMRGERGGGPPFCRSGAGHPVHGRRWCVDKGFGLGGSDVRWDRGDWEDVILRSPSRYPRERTLGERTLADILGDVVLDRVAREGRRGGHDGPITGRWAHVGPSDALVLQLRAGGAPLAELTDLDGDGRVDVMLWNRRR